MHINFHVLGTLANTIVDPISLNYKDIPNFPVSTVEGHQGNLVFGTLSNVKVVCMQGRFHYYEGYILQKCTAPVRVLALVGINKLIVTNAAGGLNPNYKVGDIMFIKDHINFLGFGGNNPLRGPNDPRFGARFIPMNKAYDRALIKNAKEITKKMGLEKSTHEGVYVMVGGPNYETIAEVNSLRMLGADAVGMSTIPEVLVAKHCAMTVFGFSIITNECISSYDDETEPNHQEVLKAINSKAESLKEFVTILVGNIAME
ncbi:hypothetical protein NQ314_015272 [Rhamnusium bicolor]|uniref:Purine nucleoside phosphorylase n=1 Tax=Rhamnusium bicolor TaxID=1586634 RepID=A0AAV8WZS9_9CUCU|nr:hypothetical protein NQ314_015272 [Rhamnusium bicolor]